MIPGYVVPGQVIVSASDTKAQPSQYVAGSGVEAFDDGFKATLLGQVTLDVVETSEGKQAIINVRNKFADSFFAQGSGPSHNSRRSTSRLPQVGDVIYARVLRLASNQVAVEILAVEDQTDSLTDAGVGWSGSAIGTVRQPNGRLGDLAEFGEGYGGLIRVQDTRSTEREKVKLEESFRPGDVVRASVLSLGDGSNYYLTTVRNDLGVVFAKSRWGHNMVPLDWQTMVAPASGETEPRKCANPFVSSG